MTNFLGRYFWLWAAGRSRAGKVEKAGRLDKERVKL